MLRGQSSRPALSLSHSAALERLRRSLLEPGSAIQRSRGLETVHCIIFLERIASDVLMSHTAVGAGDGVSSTQSCGTGSESHSTQREAVGVSQLREPCSHERTMAGRIGPSDLGNEEKDGAVQSPEDHIMKGRQQSKGKRPIGAGNPPPCISRSTRNHAHLLRPVPNAKE